MRWWILAVLGIAQLMVILDNTIVNIALPTAQHDLDFSNADRQWVVTAYSLAFGSLLLLGGRIGDIIGRKRALIIGLVGFAVASAIGGASVNFPMLVTARTVQGAFGALLAPSVLALLTTTFTDADERGKAFGIYGGIAGAGGALGLLLGGILTSYVSWRWTLFVNLVFAAVATAGAMLWLKNDKAADRDPLDIPGLLLVTGGLFCLVFGFSHAETTAWSDPYTIGFLVVGVILLAASPGSRPGPGYPLLPPRVVLRTGPGVVRCWPCCSPASGSSGSSCSSPTTCRAPSLQPGQDRRRLPPPDRRAGRHGAGVQPVLLLPRFGPKVDRADRAARECRGVVPAARGRAAQLVREPRAALSPAAGPRVRAEPRPFVQHRHAGARPPGRRGGVGHPQHVPTGGRIGRHGPPEHPGRRGRHHLPGRPGPTPANLQTAALHSYTTAFLWSALIFVVGAVVAGLVLPRGNMRALSGLTADGAPAEPVAQGRV